MISMFVRPILILSLVWVSVLGRTIDEIIRDAARMGKGDDLGAGEILLDMDMKYTKEVWEYWTSKVDAQKGIRGERFRWTNNYVPYEFDATFTAEQRAVIRAAMDEWEKYTCLTLGPRNGETNYVYIQDNISGCNSYVGMQGGRQTMNLLKYACIHHAVIAHEFGHAIGFQHEHQRPERDSYVRINLNNVGDEWKFAFDKFKEAEIDNRGVQYEYLSLMHYGKTAFSKDNQALTVIPYDSIYTDMIGNSPGLVFDDIKLANLLYSCSAGCGDVSCPTGAYVDKDCKCQCDNRGLYSPICECGTTDCGKGDDVPDIDCIDKDTNCDYWASVGECSANPRYMLYNCPKACGLCGDNAECNDYHSECSTWKSAGHCDNPVFKDYLRRYCRKSCLC